MPTPKNILITLAIPVVSASVFVRLGFWQLDRLKGRRAFNETVVTRLREEPVAVGALPTDTAFGHYRRAAAAGTLEFDREVLLAGRSHDGSPGVNILTPLHAGMGDTVVLVNRGWAYSPDAATLDASHWRESPSATIDGYAETFVGVDARPQGGNGHRVRSLDRAALERAIGLPLAPYILVQTSDTGRHGDSVPVRLKLPALDEGPHRSYALQWFAFAIIAVVGGVALTIRSR